MLWIILSILAGLGDATTYAIMKKVKGINPYKILFMKFALALPLISIMLFFSKIPAVKNEFYLVLILNALLLILANFLIITAARVSDLSVSFPLMSFTPVFLIIISFIMIKELPSINGFIGILLIVFGAYIINLKNKKKFLEPFKSVLKEKGSLCILGTALIYSICANLNRIGVSLSSPVYFSFANYVLISIITFPFFLKSDFSTRTFIIGLLEKSGLKKTNPSRRRECQQSRTNEKKLSFYKSKTDSVLIKKNIKKLILMGFCAGTVMILASIAIQMTVVSYVISLKRFSVIFSVLYGYILFKEKNLKKSLIGASIMFLGAMLITLF